ncbi:MAG TPA: septal ring lytic transglycosylase RlpA family protein, partial [Aestuariivirga sp.]|nr:septal ring lytic transglycosylase RlpA family protein [Aestuariivirga sp.]
MILPLVLVVAGLAVSGCTSKKVKHGALDPFAGTGSPYYAGQGDPPKGGGRYLVGAPYKVAGRRFTPREQPRYDATGPASWYGEDFNHRMTSNGEWFNMNDLTAAHPTLPLPSYVKVTNLDNGSEIVVRVNDRGPFVGPRIIDMSKRSAEVLGFKDKGKARVRVQYIGAAPLNDRGSHLAAMNRGLQQGTPLKAMIAAADRSEATMVASAAPASPPVAAQPEFVLTAAAPAPQMVVPQATASVDGSYYIQVGSFSDAGNAEMARASFANVWPVQVVTASASGSEVYRVRIGPIAGETDAIT